MSCLISGRCCLSFSSTGIGSVMTMTLVIILKAAVLYRNCVRSTHDPGAFGSHVFLMGRH